MQLQESALEDMFCAPARKPGNLGNVQSMNLVMIGALTKVEPFFGQDDVRRRIQELSGELAAANVRAFDEGCLSEMATVGRAT